MNDSFISYFVRTVLFLRRFIKVEKKNGTIRAAYRYIVTAITTTLVFVLISLFLYKFEIAAIVYMGIWPIIMSEMVIDCILNPDLSYNMSF